MGWGTIDTEAIVESPAGSGAFGAYHELNPGESASIEVLRTDTPTESWAASILQSVDGTVSSDVAVPRRVFGLLDLRPIFSQDSIGVRYFQVFIQNPNTGPTDVVAATIRVITDGVNL